MLLMIELRVSLHSRLLRFAFVERAVGARSGVSDARVRPMQQSNCKVGIRESIPSDRFGRTITTTGSMERFCHSTKAVIATRAVSWRKTAPVPWTCGLLNPRDQAKCWHPRSTEAFSGTNPIARRPKHAANSGSGQKRPSCYRYRRHSGAAADIASWGTELQFSTIAKCSSLQLVSISNAKAIGILTSRFYYCA